jgi:hypothetical protein
VLFGTGPVEPLAARAPKLESLESGPLTLTGVEVFRVTYEIARRDSQSFFPPALQATVPPLVSWCFHRCTDGPLGAFCLAEARLHCKSGARTRTYLLASLIDSPSAGAALTAGWGFGPRTGVLSLERGYDRVDARASLGGRCILELSMLDPGPLGPGDIHFAPGMHPAHTPSGLRLLQVDTSYRVLRSERGRPRLHAFSAADWQEERVRPVFPVAASLASADLTLERLRFMSRPEVSAFDGTEAIG